MRKAAIVLFVVALVFFAAARAEEPPRGHLVLNGGGEKPRAVMDKFIELAGGTSASILIVPTASSEKDTNDYYKKLLGKDYGCTNVMPLSLKTRLDAAREDYVKLIGKAGGVFFAGGDQRRIITTLRETPVGRAIEEAFERGAVMGGTSAGTACMSPLMITGEGNFEVIATKSVELWPGLGFFSGVIVDQHFIRRQRENRLFSVILEHPELLGVGVDEDTAVWVRPDRTFQVLGDGSVFVLDASSASVVRTPAEKGSELLGVRDLRVHILRAGDVYDMNTRKLIPTAAESETRHQTAVERLRSAGPGSK